MNQPTANRQHQGTISLSDEDAVKQVIVKTVFGLWDIVNGLTKLRPSKRERFRVTIFGSARAERGTFAYDEVKRLASELAAMDCDIITGGGPGLMQAANEGAEAAGAIERERSVGIRVDLPFEQTVNPFVEQMFEHKTFFTRLHHFVLTSDAFVVVPGGIGTVLELMMIWQLLQVKHVENTPLILVGKIWEGLIDWARIQLLSTQPPLISPPDIDIPICVGTADEAIAMIRTHHDEWVRKSAKLNANPNSN
ncbi:MAG: LOG family protein [Planctomycetaceae bacterium]